MEIDYTEIPGCVLLTQVERANYMGTFQEHFNAKRFRDAGLPGIFTQDNLSFSISGVIRGLHIQSRWPQGKLVRVIKGKIFSVCLDLRHGSPAFGQWHGVILSEDNQQSFMVPEGCAHGYAAIEESLVLYKCTTMYDADSDGGIHYDDPELGIDWFKYLDTDEPLVSVKDKLLPSMAEYLKGR